MPRAGGRRVTEVLELRRPEIIARFVARAREVGAASSLADEEIVDQLREYLDELAARAGAEPLPAGSPTAAAIHGEHRFLHGYDLVALIREYGALGEVLWEVLVDEERVPLDQVRGILAMLHEAIAESSARYVKLRDAELRQQTSRHVAFLAHELRNPISSALMAAMMLGTRVDSRSARTCDAIVRGIRKASQLIDDALVTVRLRELGRMSCQPLDLAQLARAIAEESAGEAEAKRIRIVVRGEATIEADPKALRSALSNLVRNAVKFSHADGEVDVRVRTAEGRAVIEVEDECGGLPDGAEMKLFDPYVQAGADRSGFGLGLAIAKQAAEAHEGQLRVHDLPGKGCVFVLDLPARAPAAGQAPR